MLGVGFLLLLLKTDRVGGLALAQLIRPPAIFKKALWKRLFRSAPGDEKMAENILDDTVVRAGVFGGQAFYRGAAPNP
ncbi:MAG: hypothetical protein CM15mP95_2650 [Alphaproteobacteria bacterium]|nr:MAG: hypothetical protein CM15mP95_2650 [Alphaproteobacteria bacterium]